MKILNVSVIVHEPSVEVSMQNYSIYANWSTYLTFSIHYTYGPYVYKLDRKISVNVEIKPQTNLQILETCLSDREWKPLPNPLNFQVTLTPEKESIVVQIKVFVEQPGEYTLTIKWSYEGKVGEKSFYITAEPMRYATLSTS